MRKVLLLDHDGVICLHDDWGSRYATGKTFDNFDKKAIKVLNQIIKETDCEIIISSDWRLYTDFQGLVDLYKEEGISKQPAGITAIRPYHDYSLPEHDRATDIKEWVGNNLTEEDRWVAVDDLDLSSFIQKNFVRTPRPWQGIKQTGIKNKIIRILTNEK